MRPIILFDLDGTLVDSKPGIVQGLIHTLQALGIAPPPALQLEAFIGPPLQFAFCQLLETDDVDDVENAIALYRNFYRERGIFDCQVFAGVPELLKSISAAGRRAFVVTSKPEPFARQVLEHLELRPHFVEVHGASFDTSRAHKADVLAYALTSSRLDPTQAVMIGDRDQDLLAAQTHQTASIGALWGYGSRAELEACRAGGLAESPGDLAELLGCPI